MATKVFDGRVGEVIPATAQYAMPDQAARTTRSVTKILPKDAGPFTAGRRINLQFPADGYCNGMNCGLAFDFVASSNNANAARITGSVVAASNVLTFADSDLDANRNTADAYVGWYMIITQFFSDDNDGVLFSGSALHRILTWSSGRVATVASGNGATTFVNGTYSAILVPPYVIEKSLCDRLFKRVRITYGGNEIELDDEHNTKAVLLKKIGASDGYRSGTGAIMEGNFSGFIHESDNNADQWERSTGGQSLRSEIVQRLLATHKTTRYVWRPDSDFLTNKKLLPFKWLTAQLQVELTLAPNEEVFQVDVGSTLKPSYELQNVEMITEFVELGDAYDQAFFAGMQAAPVALHFSSWHYFSQAVTGREMWLNISDRSRSVKNAFAVIRDTDLDYTRDPCLFYYDAAQYFDTGRLVSPASGSESSVEEFQWRIGQRYIPSQPVNCTKGAPEAYMELQKTLNAYGDYTFNNGISCYDWSTHYDNTRGHCFVIATEFEYTDYRPGTVAGIDAQEMNDLVLRIKFKNSLPALSKKKIDVWIQYDNIAYVMPGNRLDLAQ